MSRTPKARNLFTRLDDRGIQWLCGELVEGRSLRGIAQELGATAPAILLWLRRDPARMEEYRQARRFQVDVLIDDLVELADSPLPVDAVGRTDPGAVQQLRIRIDTRKWVAAKFYPALYGDRMGVDASVNATVSELPPDKILERIVGILAAHGLKISPADGGNGAAADL